MSSSLFAIIAERLRMTFILMVELPKSLLILPRSILKLLSPANSLMSARIFISTN